MSSQVVVHRARPRVGRTTRVFLSLVLVAGVTGGAVYVSRQLSAGTDTCGAANGVELHIVVSPDIAPAVTRIANQWTATHPVASGQCVRATVAAGSTKAPTDGGAPGGTAMWIPDSSTWIAEQQTVDRTTFSGSSVSIATSPVVFAVGAKNTGAQKAAKALLNADGHLDLAKLGGAVEQSCASGKSAGFTLGLDDPTTDAASLAAVTWFGAQVTNADCEMAFFRQIGHLDDRAALLTAVAAGTGGVDTVPLPEQAVLAYDSTHVAAPLAAIAPAQSGRVLDYPAAIYAGLPVATATAAATFRDYLSTPAAAGVLAAAGFRAVQGSEGAGFPDTPGIDSTPVDPTPMDSATPVKSDGGFWQAATKPARALALIDTGPTMSTVDPHFGGKSRIDLITKLAGGGLDLFQPEDELGLWAFGGDASSNKLGYTPVVAPALLDAKQQTAIGGTLQVASPAGSDDCGFFPAVLAAYKYMSANFDPAKANTLVVFTDTTDGCGKPLSQLETQLQQLAETDKPIALIILGIGKDVNMASLGTLSNTVSGKVFPVTPTTDIGTVFMEALLEIANSLAISPGATN